MGSIALRQVIPGVATTVAATLVVILMTGAYMTSDPSVGEQSPWAPMSLGQPMTTVSISGTPQGEVRLVAQIAAPAASPYLWSAEKAADGSVSFAGFVPSKEVRESLVDGIGQVSGDTTAFASGAPDGFADDALAGLAVLATLDNGKIAFDGSAWSIAGAVDSADKGKAAQDAFDASALKALNATYSVTAPAVQATAATPPASPPTVTAAPATPAAAATPATPSAAAEPVTPATPAVTPPYAWSAEKTADGAVTFTGSVPNAGLDKYLAVVAGDKAVDKSTVAAGAPEGFIDASRFGLIALLTLDSGKLSLADGVWSLTGATRDDATSAATLKALSAATDTKAWKLAVETVKPVATAPATAVVAAPATTPAPAAASTPAEAAPAAVAAKPEAPVASVPAGAPYVFDATRSNNGAVALSGEVPADAAKRYFGVIAGEVGTDGLKVTTGAPASFIDNARGGIAALTQLADGQLGFDGQKWSLKGKSATPERRTAILAAIAALPEGKLWTTDIAGPTDIELCRQRVADFSKTNSIAFTTGTKIAKGVDAVLDALAADLALCPAATVNVEGYTDSDGDANADMALSVARSEAVVDALVKRGIKQDRLYAIGYGKTLPLLPNTSKANKLKNRRIEIKILDAPKS